MTRPAYAARLRACKRRSDHAPTILQLWIDGGEHSDGIDGATLVTLDEPAPCSDCGETRTLYVWRRWPAVCAWCSLARFEHGGENPRTADRAEQRARRRRRTEG